MKKKTVKKLVLAKETVRELNSRTLEVVAVGASGVECEFSQFHRCIDKSTSIWC